ncbi:MAG TPA: amidase [Steroidobacteraceae bacterium]
MKERRPDGAQGPLRQGGPAIADLLASYAARRTTATAVAQRHLARIGRLDPALHAFIEVDETGALRAAAEADARIAAGSPRSLEGIPVAIKANIAVAGLGWSAGMEARRGVVAQNDAASVRLLRTAGAVILGTLNMHEAAFGATTDNPWFGRAMNPHRAGYTPGGSSGGSGAAVAAGLCVAALGSDTLGSVRIPAAYNGIYGLKPTHGAISSEGLVPLASDLDTVGPLTRSLDDLEVLTRVLLPGPGGAAPRRADAGEPGRCEVDVGRAGLCTPSPQRPDPQESAKRPPALRRLLVLQSLAEEWCEPAITAAYQLASAALGALSAESISLPHPLARVRLAAFMVAGRALATQPHIVRASAAAGLTAELVKLLEICGQRSELDLVTDQEVLTRTAAALRACVEPDAVLLLPTTPQAAFAHTPRPPSSQASFTVLASIAGLPAISLPAGCNADGLPLGVQLVGPGGRELELIALARALDARLSGYVPPLLE